ncbi:MAG: GNAT family N-acetyltransferase [Filifactoraceae bacterium]
MEIRRDLNIEDFKAMEILEQCCYGREYITDFNEAYKWYQTYPYTVLAAFEGDDLAGFVNFFPVTEYVMDELKAGRFSDRNLKVEHIVDINSEENFNMFLCCVVVSPFYQERGLANYLLKSATKQYKDIESRCNYVITENVTKEGEALSKRYGLKIWGESQYKTKIYIGDYKSFVKLL